MPSSVAVIFPDRSAWTSEATMPSERDRWVGQRLAVARKAAGLTVRQLADHLGWPDHSRLTSYETGRRALSVVTLMEIAQALGQAPAALLVESPEEAEIITQVVGNRERAQQLAYLIQLLGEGEPAPSDAAA
jgi:transcriptional regulator with XRE-family HTH domain